MAAADLDPAATVAMMAPGEARSPRLSLVSCVVGKSTRKCQEPAGLPTLPKHTLVSDVPVEDIVGAQHWHWQSTFAGASTNGGLCTGSVITCRDRLRPLIARASMRRWLMGHQSGLTQ